METIFEILYEIIIEGAMGIVNDEKFPREMKIAVAIIIFGGLLALFIVIAIDSWSDGRVGWTIFLSILIFALLVFLLFAFIKPPKDKD